jgi:class 3 adenylate cyclase/tetratricopeptide (TPR) repeat protein
MPEAPVATRFTSPGSYTPKHLVEKILTSRAALEGERKQVTVLFADLKGSMELLADRDPEEARKILDPVLQRMMEAVHRYEGTVNQVMGDGIMALFGAPVAHEDHTVRACYAALDMQAAIRRFAEEIRRNHGVVIQVRVGLNSGEVVVRAIGSDLRMDYTAVGQTTHLAARMEQLAKPDTTLLTADVLGLAEGFIAVTPLGRVPVKGLKAPIEVYELTRATTIRSRFRVAAARGLTHFVGRESELDQLRRALEREGSGHGQVVAVMGEPGIGKSRLYWEFSHSHRAQGWLMLESGSVSYGKATPYLPVIDLMKTYFKIVDSDDSRAIHEKVIGKLLALDRALEPMLTAFLALLDVPIVDAQWQALDPVQRRQRTIEAVKRLLLRESQVQPLLVVFEDLHWIDSETQGVLDSLIESLPTARVLLLVNYRPEYRHRWGSKTYYTQVHLDALPQDSATELLYALAGDDPSLAPLKRLLITHTGGNPFLLEESVRTLVETKGLVGERGAYRLAQPIGAIQVPASVQAVLAARIDRLPPEEKHLLQAAAVIGKDVPFAVLQAIADIGQEHLRVGLTHLQSAEFLYETTLFPDLEYTFKHALTHDVAYSSVLHDRRRGLHAQIVAAIEATYADRLVEHTERLAHHALHGEAWDTAVRYSREAGWKSFARSANREATAYFEQALLALSKMPDKRWKHEMAVDLRLDLYSSMLPLERLRPVLAYLYEAETLARALNDQRRLGWARLHICHLLVLIDDCSTGVDIGQDALAIGESIGDSTLQIVAILWLGCAYYALGEHRRAVEFLRQGLQKLEAETKGTAFPALQIPLILRSYLSMFLAEMGEFTEAEPVATDALAMAEALDHPYSLATAYWQVAHFYLARGDFQRAVPLLERGAAVGREWGYVRVAALNDSPLGFILALLGRSAEGLTVVQRGMEATEGIGLTWLRGRRLTYHGETCLLAGRVDEANALALQAVQFCRERKERGFQAWALRLLGEIRSRDPPETQAAQDHYQQALVLATDLEMRPLVAHCHLGLGKLFCRTGNREQAQEQVTVAMAMYREMDMPYWLEQAKRAMCKLAEV